MLQIIVSNPMDQQRTPRSSLVTKHSKSTTTTIDRHHFDSTWSTLTILITIFHVSFFELIIHHHKSVHPSTTHSNKNFFEAPSLCFRSLLQSMALLPFALDRTITVPFDMHPVKHLRFSPSIKIK
jgi:hypothetical protein